MTDTPLHEAIRDLGGQTDAAPRIGRSQSSISEALKKGRPSAEMCMAIEAATNGKHTCERLRPDLAPLFKVLRAKPSKKRAN